MEGGRVKEVPGTICGENEIIHIMTGKAGKRAFRGHPLVDQCFTNQDFSKELSPIIPRVTNPDCEFEIYIYGCIEICTKDAYLGSFLLLKKTKDPSKPLSNCLASFVENFNVGVGD